MDIIKEIELIGKIIENDSNLSKEFEEYIKASKEGKLMQKLNEGREEIKINYDVFNK